MSIFDRMTQDEQQGWWLEHATTALANMNMTDVTVEWLAYTHHAVFAVKQGIIRFVLKMSLPAYRQQLHDEYQLLDVLSTWQLPIAQPIATVESDHTYAILISHLEGESPTAETVTVEHMHAIGKFLASFHQTVRDVSLNLRRLDWDGLFADDGMYYPGDENMTVFSPEQLHVIDAVTEKVKGAMDSLGTSTDEMGLIHGDLLLKNILFHNDEMRALDFEYCGRGYYLYDLTPVLWQLKPQDHYPHLEQALWDGYTSVRALLDEHRNLLETLIAARQVASMRWIAANQQNPYFVGKVDSILEQRSSELADFLKTNQLNRQ